MWLIVLSHKHIWYDYWPRSFWRIRHNYQLQWPDSHLGYWHYSNQRQRYKHSIIRREPDLGLYECIWTTYSQTWIFLGYENSRFWESTRTSKLRWCHQDMWEPPCRGKALTQNITVKYEHLFDGILGEFNMDLIPINLQLMVTKCKPVHAHAYIVPRSVEQQFQRCK
jgi:hypothetical protein